MFSNLGRYESARAHVKCRPEEAHWDAALQQEVLKNTRTNKSQNRGRKP